MEYYNSSMATVLDFTPLVLKYSRNRSEDVRAEAWLAVVEAMNSYDLTKGVPLAGYVKSRVKFAVWNMIKKQQRQWQHEITMENTNDQTLLDTLASNTNVAKEVEQIFLVEKLRAAISKLTDHQRIAVIKTVICNYGQTETAATLGVTPQAVFNLRTRGLANLRKILNESESIVAY